MYPPRTSAPRQSLAATPIADWTDCSPPRFVSHGFSRDKRSSKPTKQSDVCTKLLKRLRTNLFYKIQHNASKSFAVISCNKRISVPVATNKVCEHTDFFQRGSTDAHARQCQLQCLAALDVTFQVLVTNVWAQYFGVKEDREWYFHARTNVSLNEKEMVSVESTVLKCTNPCEESNGL